MEAEEQEKSLSLGNYWQAALERRWWILAATFLCWAIAWIASWTLPVRYRSETLILVEPQKVPQEYVVSNVSSGMEERLQSISEQILSRTRLQRIIQDFKLYSQRGGDLPPDAVVERMRKDIQVELVQSPSKRDVTAFRIGYSAPSAVLAQQVATKLTSLFITENLEAQAEQSETTTRFLASQLEEARNSLAGQEAREREFKARYLGQLPSQMQNNLSILSGLQNRYEALTASLNHSRQQKLYLESLLSQYRALGTGSSNDPQTVPGIDQELTRLRSELADVQARYTEEHPDVVRLKNRIARAERLKQQIEAANSNRQVKAEPQTKPASTLAELQAMSPLLQIEGQLKVNQQEIKDTQAQMNALEGQIREYQGRLNMAPAIEQQLADLTRDYDQSKANYDSLLKKQMQSQMATDLEKSKQGQQFRMLDPPSLPQKPFWPNRIRFSLGGLAAGLALGLLAAVGMELLEGRIRSEQELDGLVQAKVLVSLPHVSSPGEDLRLSRQHRIEWVAAVIVMGIIAAGNMVSLLKG